MRKFSNNGYIAGNNREEKYSAIPPYRFSKQILNQDRFNPL